MVNIYYAFFLIVQDDLEEAPARRRATVDQEGPQAKCPARQAAGQPDQTTDKPDAELVNAHQESSSGTLQVWHLAQFIDLSLTSRDSTTHVEISLPSVIKSEPQSLTLGFRRLGFSKSCTFWRSTFV